MCSNLKRWLRYARPYALYFVVGPLCMIVEVIGEIVLPKLYANIVNVGIETGNVRYIVVTCLLMILMALLMRKTLFSGEAVPFVMELPNYRMPGAKNVGHLLWDKAKDFLQRAFTVIFMATLVIWFLQTFNTHLSIVTDSKDSILAMVASVIAPIFKPMGYGDWRISTALITGFMAKESVVSTLSILFGNTAALLGSITSLSAASLLAFCLLYTPCVAAIASIKRELGGKWAIFVVLAQCVIAWLVSFAVYLVGGLFF